MSLMDDLDQVRYGVFPETENVIILAAGPSINANYDKLNQIVDSCNNIILACNYSFTRVRKIPEYTVYIDPGAYRRNYGPRIKSPNILVGPTCILKEKHLDGKNFMKFKWNAKVQPFDVKQMIVHSDGSTGHKLSNCGLACLYLSHFFKPKRVIVAGMDGPEPDNSTYRHFNNVTKKLDSINVTRIKLKKRYLKKLLLPFLASQGIEVLKFSNSKFMNVRVPNIEDCHEFN